mmetsp:Transcript_16274/g.28598  ORF Transcript_16274/g.28598 Transcript_16274/m.28598 type:complete len:373 (+) Transcript_16274:264-1382(+)
MPPAHSLHPLQLTTLNQQTIILLLIFSDHGLWTGAVLLLHCGGSRHLGTVLNGVFLGRLGLRDDMQLLAGLRRGVLQELLIHIVRRLNALGAHLQHRFDLFAGHLAGEVNIVVGQLVPQAQHGEDGEFHDGDLLKDTGLDACVLGLLALLVGLEVLEVHGGVVVVSHVVVLAEEIVFAVHDGRAVDHLDVVSVLVVLDEPVEANVDQREEIAHAHQGLNHHPEDKHGAAGDCEDGHHRADVKLDAALELLRLGLHAMGIKELQTGVTHHVHQNAVDVQHEVTEATSVDVPLVEGIAHAAVQTVMDEVVRGGEVPRHIAEENSQPVLEEVAHERVTDVLLVQTKVVTLLMCQPVSSSHNATTNANPGAVVCVN